jgi:hypothetical protein
MNRFTFNTQVDKGLGQWICQDKTDEELSLFDMVNIAQCAVRRAQEHLMNARFTDEFYSVRCWTKKAGESVW